MDRALLEQAIQESERDVAEGRRHIERQRELIAELEQAGHDSRDARELLTVLEDTQQSHEEHLDRLARELKSVDR